MVNINFEIKLMIKTSMLYLCLFFKVVFSKLFEFVSIKFSFLLMFFILYLKSKISTLKILLIQSLNCFCNNFLQRVKALFLATGKHFKSLNFPQSRPNFLLNSMSNYGVETQNWKKKTDTPLFNITSTIIHLNNKLKSCECLQSV